jgi:cytoskeletal protein RodZ
MKLAESGFFSGFQLGVLLENARQIKGWTATDAAARIGVGEKHIKSIETGDYREFGNEVEILKIKLRIYAKKLDMNNDTIYSLIDATLTELENP